eukprot:TRINITY_DN20665_c0_g1_i1.p1 TRINITY_DN20665_c0_g1~~TRINITY_DN20665_c0_g1_i1.p1  ORF type:complete len:211 (+),score=38.17 TRINITY_DN20665_c0_g1_i1:86-634(+)
MPPPVTVYLLGCLGMPQYTAVLAEAGFDYADDLVGITLQELIGIGVAPGHAASILAAAAEVSGAPAAQRAALHDCRLNVARSCGGSSRRRSCSAAHRSHVPPVALGALGRRPPTAHPGRALDSLSSVGVLDSSSSSLGTPSIKGASAVFISRASDGGVCIDFAPQCHSANVPSPGGRRVVRE